MQVPTLYIQSVLELTIQRAVALGEPVPEQQEIDSAVLKIEQSWPDSEMAHLWRVAQSVFRHDCASHGCMYCGATLRQSRI